MQKQLVELTAEEIEAVSGAGFASWANRFSNQISSTLNTIGNTGNRLIAFVYNWWNS